MSITTVRACEAPIPKRDTPQAVNGNWLAMAVLELTEEGSAARIEGIDAPVAEIAHQHSIAERAEIGGSQGRAPGGVERGVPVVMEQKTTICYPYNVTGISRPHLPT